MSALDIVAQGHGYYEVRDPDEALVSRHSQIHTAIEAAIKRAREIQQPVTVRQDLTLVVTPETVVEPEPDPEPTPDPTPKPEPSPDPGIGIIPEEAATMQRGEWRNIMHRTNLSAGSEFQSFQRVHGTDGGSASADGIGWTQDLGYHEGKLLILAMRDRSPVSLIVMEPDGEFWRQNNLPLGGGRRPFNRLAQDATHLYYFPGQLPQLELGKGYRTSLDDPGEFEQVIPGFQDEQADSVGNFSVTYVPDWDRFYAISPGGVVWSIELGETGWHNHGRTPYDRTAGDEGRVSGYASAIVWNDFTKELVLMGGQGFGSPPGAADKVARMTEPNGEIQALEDLRTVDGEELFYTSAEGKLFPDPRDGTWMLQSGRTKMYRSTGDASGPYELYADLHAIGKPFGSFEAYTPLARVPGTEVIVFLSHRNGVILHRPGESAGGTVPDEPTDEPAPEPVTPPAPGALEGSWLLDTAEAMETGFYAPVDAALPDGYANFGDLMFARMQNTNSADFWAPVAVWNPVRQQALFVLDRTPGADSEDSVNIFGYDAASHSWFLYPLPADTGGEFGAPHVYGRWALDIERQRLYRPYNGQLWVLDIDIGEWLEPRPFANFGPGTGGVAVHEATGEMLAMNNDGRVLAWDPETDVIRTVGQDPTNSGHHAHAVYNPLRREVAFAFGGGAVMTLVGAQGQVRSVPIPAEARAGGSATSFLFWDPGSGDWIIYEHERKQVWEYDGDTWRMAYDVGANDPWPPFHGYLICPIPEAGVIMWLHRSDFGGDGRHQRLYKHPVA